MKKCTDKKCSDLKEFDDTVSIYQLIPAGKGNALSQLKTIVDSIHNSPQNKIPSILITGGQGKRTHARAFYRALAIEWTNEIHGSMLQPAFKLLEFFSFSPYIAHIISDAEKLVLHAQEAVVQILREQRFSYYDYPKERCVYYEVPGPIVLTADTIEEVAEPVVDALDFIVELEPYTQEQMELVVLQRLKYCGLEYDDEKILAEIVKYGEGRMRKIIRFLRLCIAVAGAEGRREIMLVDVRKAERLGNFKTKGKTRSMTR